LSISKIRMKQFLIFIFLSNASVSHVTQREKQIREFIEDELDHYPEARLADLYKNYFQDAFGPGHLIEDSGKAGAYMDWELRQSDWADTISYQALGCNHDYYRVNLTLLKKGTIPRDIFLSGVIKSAPLARKPDIESWIKEWNEVLQTVKMMRPDLPDLQSDEKLIAETLAKGEVVMHHSRHFEATYHPHYRIIHRSVFDIWMKENLLK